MDDIGQSAGKNLGWLAGFICGDGSICLDKAHIANGRFIYSPKVIITNTDYNLILHSIEILKAFEIGHYITSKKTVNFTAYMIIIKGFKRVKKFLNLIIDYLEGKKKDQAKIILAWLKSRETTGCNVSYNEYELGLIDQLKSLRTR